MQKAKLVLVMSALPEKMLEDARGFLLGRVSGTRSPVIKLFDALSHFHPRYEDSKLSREYIFRRTYWGEPFNAQKLRNLMTVLLQHLEDFLVLREVERGGMEYNRLLAKAYKNLRSSANLKRVAGDSVRQLEEQPARGLDYYRRLAALKHELFFYAGYHSLEQGRDALQALVEAEEAFHLLACMEYGADTLVRRRSLKEGIPVKGLQEAVQKAASYNPREHPVLAFFPLLLQLYQEEGSDRLYEEVATAFQRLENRMGPFDRALAYKTIANYLLSHSNRGSLKHTRQLVDIYKLGLEKGLLLVKGRISAERFTNIVVAALLVQDFQWAEDFLERYEPALEKEVKETVSLCRAYWHYHHGWRKGRPEDFETALDYLNKGEWTGLNNKLRQRSLRLRIGYDYHLNNGIGLDVLIDWAINFERALNRAKNIADEKVTAYKRFLYFYKELLEAKGLARPLNGQLEKLKQVMEEDPPTVLTGWLTEKIKEL